MARGVNKVILIGNLGRDPEIRYTQDQRPIANLRIATSDRWQDRATNEWRDRTEWHTVVCFARLAEICGEYLRKGSKVYIEGRLQTRNWEGQDGQTRYSTEVVARELMMLDRRGEGGGYGGPEDPGAYGGQSTRSQGGGPADGGYGREPPSGGRRPAANPPSTPSEPDDFEDDIPF